MPTGYTCYIKDGISFNDFAMKCARAFETCIDMRDGSLDSKIPKKFNPSTYYKERMNEIVEEIKEANSITKNEIIEICNKNYLDEIRRSLKRANEKDELKQKYNDMLVEVFRWTPPTEDHIELKNFMISQIEESIDFDCSFYDYEIKKENYIDYKQNKIRTLKEDLMYHIKQHKNEVKRTYKRNKWIKDLRESLKGE